MKRIDLNCDMGESFGAYKLGMDEEVIKLITSANIACGYHAGDPNVMDRTVQIAKENNVGIGVHMGFPDLLGFGRRNMDVAYGDLVNYNIYQIGALEAFCRKHGVEIQHIKPHGNMNNMADTDRVMAEAIVESVRLVLPNTPIYVKPGSQLHKVSEEKNVPFVLEIFADRAYNKDGTLVSRKIPGAVIKDPKVAAENIVRMVVDGKAKTIDGELIDMTGDTICVHGDTQGSLEIIRYLRNELENAGVQILPIGQKVKEAR
jgi:5-oxoprolinase (ATP-hydrolysing) subunit A